MSFLDKFTQFFGMSDEDDYGYEEEQDSMTPPSVSSMSHSTQQPSVGYQRSAVNSRVEQSKETSELNYQHQQSVPQSTEYRSRNVVSMQQRGNKVSGKSRVQKENRTNKIIIIEPRAYSEAMKIAKHIMNGESVLVNFHQIEEYQARRIVDFLTGTVYAENGDIKRVGNEIFLCTAQGVEIDGTAQSLMDANMLEIQ